MRSFVSSCHIDKYRLTLSNPLAMTKQKREKKKLFGFDIDDPKIPINLLKIVVILWLSSWILSYLLFGSNEWETRGQFGDSFGAINALFSGLAFAGIVYTIIIQRKDLSDQQEEIKKQNTAIKRQRFENTFFSMLKIHSEQLSQLRSHGNIHEGRDYLGWLVDSFNTPLSNRDLVKYENTFEKYDTYRGLYQRHQEAFLREISHYLQSLFVLYLNIIHYTKQPDVRAKYFTILKSYISFPERRFLFYHITLGTDIGVNHSLRVMERDLNLLKSIGEEALIDTSHILLIDSYDTRFRIHIDQMYKETNSNPFNLKKP
jgi:hypothetical protein